MTESVKPGHSNLASGGTPQQKCIQRGSYFRAVPLSRLFCLISHYQIIVEMLENGCFTIPSSMGQEMSSQTIRLVVNKPTVRTLSKQPPPQMSVIILHCTGNEEHKQPCSRVPVSVNAVRYITAGMESSFYIYLFLPSSKSTQWNFNETCLCAAGC